MPTMMSVNEAKANFSGTLSEVESGLIQQTGNRRQEHEGVRRHGISPE